MVVTNRSQRAFTLIEVALALVILLGSLVILIGLQSSVIRRTLRDADAQRALLLIRQIMTPIELGLEPLQVGNSSGSIDDIFRKVSPAGMSDRPDLPEDKRFNATLAVQPWRLPGADTDLMQHVTLDVHWTDNPEDHVAVNFFVPIPIP